MNPDTTSIKTMSAIEAQARSTLREAVKNALSLAAYFQGVFSSSYFTDRHGDAERCDKARKYYAEVLAQDSTRSLKAANLENE